jgi:hypothetical protein
MSELKTQENDASAEAFIEAVPDETKRRDGFVLLELFRRVTGQEPRMWGTAIIGFGKYHYKSERSRQEGDWPLVGFSPRKQNLTLYIHPAGVADLLEGLGKHKTSMGCLYINKLADVDMAQLEKVVTKAYSTAKQKLS